MESFKNLNTVLQKSSSGSLPSRQVQMSGYHSSRCWASSFSLLYPSTIIQSSIICLCLPLDLFPNIFPSIIVFNNDSPLRVCPIHFYCLVSIMRIRGIFLLQSFSILFHLSYVLTS